MPKFLLDKGRFITEPNFLRRDVPVPADFVPAGVFFIRPEPELSPVLLPDDVLVPAAAEIFFPVYFFLPVPDERKPVPDTDDF